MRYLSVCSGIEAATVAWEPLGWKAAAYSEIEAFPSKVLNHHYPEVRNLGDMTKFEEWDIGTIDLLVGGTPCQSFSVAGLRKGLDDPRGNLMLTYLAIARRHRPKWLVWENVPGVLSSNGGEDFASLLRGLVELGYGWAYRILDAQYFGVAQRRRRVFVVGCLGDWRSAAAVLFERSSLSGHPAPSREKRQRVASSSQSGPTYGGSNPNLADTVTSKWAKGSGGPAGNEAGLFVAQPAVLMDQGGSVMEVRTDGTTGTLRRETHGHEPIVMQPTDVPEVMSTLLSSTAGVSRPGNEATEHETYIPMAFTPSSIGDYREGVGTLRANGGDVGGGSENLIAQPVNIYGGNKRSDRPEGGFYVQINEETSKTLDAASGLNPTCSQGGTAVIQPIPIDSMNHIGRRDDHSFADFEPGAPSYTLTKGHHHAVAQPIPIACVGGQHPNAAMDIEKSPTLTNAMGSGGGHIPLVNQAVAQPITFSSVQSNQGINPELEVSQTLESKNPMAVAQPIAWDEDLNAREDVAGTLIRGGEGGRRDGVMAPTLTASNDPSRSPQSSEITQQVGAVYQALMAVRRLTPVECERLQGFPDNYTRIPWRKGETPDGPRYKALGNSMAVPVMAWIGQRIQAVHDLSK